MKIDNDKLKFNVIDNMKLPGDLEECSSITTSNLVSFE